MASKGTVGLCCKEISFQLFKHAWETAQLKPDKIYKDANYNIYYVVFDDIIWDDGRNKKTAKMFEIMDILDLLDEVRMLSMNQKESSKLRSELIAPILRHLFNMITDAGIVLEESAMNRIESDAFTANTSGVGSLIYKCIEVDHAHGGTVYVRGCKYFASEFRVNPLLIVPDNAELYV